MPKSKVYTTFFVDLDPAINKLISDGLDVSKRRNVIDTIEYELDFITSDIQHAVQGSKFPEVFFISVRCRDRNVQKEVKRFFSDTYDGEPDFDFEFR